MCLGGSSSPTPAGAHGYVCPKGHSCPLGSTREVPCEPGTYSPAPGAVICRTCPRGTVCASTATQEPSICPAGEASGNTHQPLVQSTQRELTMFPKVICVQLGQCCPNRVLWELLATRQEPTPSRSARPVLPEGIVAHSDPQSREVSRCRGPALAPTTDRSTCLCPCVFVQVHACRGFSAKVALQLQPRRARTALLRTAPAPRAITARQGASPRFRARSAVSETPQVGFEVDLPHNVCPR